MTESPNEAPATQIESTRTRPKSDSKATSRLLNNDFDVDRPADVKNANQQFAVRETRAGESPAITAEDQRTTNPALRQIPIRPAPGPRRSSRASRTPGGA